MSRLTNGAAALAIGASLLTLPACGEDDNQIPDVSTTSTTVPAENEAVLRDYRAFWDDFLAVTGTLTPEPRLSAHATGAELDQLNNLVMGNKLHGTISKGTLDLAPKVQSVLGDTAVVKDCVDDHTGLYKADTGQRLDTDDPQRQSYLVTMKKVGDVWKASDVDQREVGCVPE